MVRRNLTQLVKFTVVIFQNHPVIGAFMIDVDINIYSLTCYTFILTSVVCALVRWFHVCKPYIENVDYFYPARKLTIFFFAAVILQIPYVFRPMDADTWYYARTFGILYYPLCFSLVFNKYFYGKTLRQGVMLRIYFICVMTILFLMMMTALLVGPAVMEYEQTWINIITGGISLVLSLYYVRISCRIVRNVDNYHEQNYSNASDFPYSFVRKVVLIPFLWMILEWMVFISGDRDVKAIVDIVFSVLNMLLLNFILNSHRPNAEDAPKVEAVVIEGDVDEQNEVPIVEVKKVDENNEVQREVLAIVARRFMEPNLKRTEVIADVSYRKKKQAGQFITSIGFYRLVNTFRLYQMENYSKAHPEMTQEGVAISCGFKDRFALNNARKRITEIDMDLIRIGMETNA